jgi:hypothetical protein
MEPKELHTVFLRCDKSPKVWDYAIIRQTPFWAPRGTVIYGVFTSWQAPKLEEHATLAEAVKAVMRFKGANMVLRGAGMDTYVAIDADTFEDISSPTHASAIKNL